jgi:pepF/M3 family oligoendopeptidase
MPNEKLPHWDLSSVFPGLDSKQFSTATSDLARTIERIARHHDEQCAPLTVTGPAAELGRTLDRAVELFNEAFLLSGSLQVYIESFTSTNSYDAAAAKKLSELEIVQVRLQQEWTRFKGWIPAFSQALPRALAHTKAAQEHSFILRECAEQGRYLMGTPEEMLAAELFVSGSNAWSKLQRTVTSQIIVELELDGRLQGLPMPSILNLRTHPDESVRRRAWEAEMREWPKVREPLAACINGLKGSANTLNRRRGRADCLHAAIDGARIDRPTLQALLDAMKGSLPLFRRYFKVKAARLGKEKLAWWDLFAPCGVAESFSWGEARALILESFGSFAPSLRAFAERAFDRNWIDAEPRDGKSGGAFCAPVPSVRESRILCNYDGSRELVSTVAHELGHGYHNDCAYRAGKTELQQLTPATLAETASIMAETIVNESLRDRAPGAAEELALLENALINDSQIIVDIYSRFLFEKEVMERREKSELAPEELCDIMSRAQEAAYGDGLDPRFRNPWMWTWKPHYYSPQADFYNFPYAFGLLFGIGLYALYGARGAAFIPDYEKLLASTGEAMAADLAARFGIDIRTRAFWDSSIGVIGARIDRYCAL